MRTIDRLAAAGAVAISLASAAPLRAQSFDVPAGPLGDVGGKIGAQSGTTVAVADPELARRRSPGVRGRFGLREALRRALRGTGAEARFLDRRTISIVRLPARAARVQRQKVPRHPPVPPRAIEAVEEIIVTGSKAQTSLDHYPGTVQVVDIDGGWNARNGTDGASAITRVLPSLASTNLGRGREKIFIRGVADSSFNGPTQSATGQYLGDVRLTYNAPDPSLNLYDMQQVEVLVGPQAPLYGAGSLGGIVRFVPNIPDLHRFSGTAAANVEYTQEGGFGGESNIMLNLPISEGRWGARVTLSAGKRAGYIDAPIQGAKNINPTRNRGHRIALRGEGLDGWTLDFGHVGQRIESEAGQYVLRGDGLVVREPLIAQPFRSNYRLAYLRAAKPIGDAELVSTTAGVSHNLRTLFDASAFFQIPGSFEEASKISIVSHETRVSGGGRRTPWVLGASAIYSHSLVSQTLAVVDIPLITIDVVDSNFDAALYGRVTRPLSDTLSVTLGGRLTYARTESFVRDPKPPNTAASFRDGARFSRTVALDWQPGGSFSAFVRHDQGFRAGGLTAYPTLIGLVAQTYRPDTLDMSELGIRIGQPDRDKFSVRAALFRNMWRNMQADLVDITGFPYTANVGNGKVVGLDAELRWRPSPDLLLTAAAFVSDSRLTVAEPGVKAADGQPLPNVAGVGGRLAADWRRELRAGATVALNASARYVGRSRLGVGSALDIPQGGYAVVDMGAGIDFGRVALSLNIDNAANARGNTFAYGNPFSVVRRDQVTPLRPRTVRLGFDLSF